MSKYGQINKMHIQTNTFKYIFCTIDIFQHIKTKYRNYIPLYISHLNWGVKILLNVHLTTLGSLSAFNLRFCRSLASFVWISVLSPFLFWSFLFHCEVNILFPIAFEHGNKSSRCWLKNRSLDVINFRCFGNLFGCFEVCMRWWMLHLFDLLLGKLFHLSWLDDVLFWICVWLDWTDSCFL